jgi:hypothetical protein
MMLGGPSGQPLDQEGQGDRGLARFQKPSFANLRRHHLGRIVSMLEAIETPGSAARCRSAWICPSASASLRGTVRSPPLALVSLGFFVADFGCFLVDRQDVFRAMVVAFAFRLPGAGRGVEGGEHQLLCLGNCEGSGFHWMYSSAPSFWRFVSPRQSSPSRSTAM